MRLWTQNAGNCRRKLAQIRGFAGGYRAGRERYRKRWTGWCCMRDSNTRPHHYECKIRLPKRQFNVIYEALNRLPPPGDTPHPGSEAFGGCVSGASDRTRCARKGIGKATCVIPAGLSAQAELGGCQQRARPNSQSSGAAANANSSPRGTTSDSVGTNEGTKNLPLT